MKCAQHVELDVVGTCNTCGRGLCSDCVSIFTPPLCGNCALAHNKEVSKSLWIHLALFAVLFVVGLAAFSDYFPFTSAVLYTLMLAFFPSGWSFLGRYLWPSGGYMYATARWTNLVLHAAVAAVVGIIVGPIFLFKAWKELKVIRETKQAMLRE